MHHTLTVLAVLLVASLATSRAADAPPAKPLLLANYYCWYHDGQHPTRPFQHWTYPASETNALANKARKPGEPPPNSVLRPLAGLYDSADPGVAEWHVQLAKAAGIDAFLVDWWDTHNGLDQNVDRGIVAAAQKHGFKFALLDERSQFHQKLEDYQLMLVRALKRYKDHPAYLRIDGRPVVYLYQVAANPGLTAAEFPLLKKHVESEVGRVYWIVDKIAHDAKAANAGDKDREKRIPDDWLAIPGVDSFAFYSTFSNFRAHEYEELAGKFRYLTQLAHGAGKQMLLPVHPGHDNSHFVDAPYVMPRRDGQTLRDFLRAATDAGADFIMVTSWNEWPESTVIEPSSSWPDPYQYLKILAEWKGVSFTAPSLPGLTHGPSATVLKDGKPYQGIGVNYFDCFLRTLTNGDDTSYEAGFATLAAKGIPFARFCATGFWPRDMRLYQTDRAEYFRRLDGVVKAAEKHGIGLVPSLFWLHASVPDLVGEPMDQWANPQSKTHAWMRGYVREVVTRYRDSPAILAWELGNEYSLSASLPNAKEHRPKAHESLGTPATRSDHDDLTFAMLHVAFTEFGKAVRELDPRRLILTGDSFPRRSAWHQEHENTWTRDTPEQFTEVLTLANPDPISAISLHAYEEDDPQFAAVMEISRKLNKPVFVGEFGAPSETPEAAAKFRRLLKSIVDHRIPLAALWVFDFKSQPDFNVTADNSRSWQLDLISDANKALRAAQPSP
jgi:hypothetical protein